jgi:hypothetical protein
MNTPYIVVDFREQKSIVQGDLTATFGARVPSSNLAWGVHANWSFADDQLVAHVDPFGCFSLFYFANDDRIVLSSSLGQLLKLGADSSLDAKAIAAFHLIGWYLDDDTPFKSIKVLPPNGRLVWKHGKLSVTGSGHVVVFEKTTISQASAIKEYERLFAASVRACLDIAQNDILPLSGGRDSRHILLESLRQGHRPSYCVTLNSARPGGISPDVECARKLCSDLKIPHRTVINFRSKMADQTKAIELTNYCSDEHAWLVSLCWHLNERGHNFWDGIGGDVLTRNKIFSLPEASQLIAAGKFQQALDLHMKGFDRITGSTLSERVASSGICLQVAEAREQIFANFSAVQPAPDPNSQFVFRTRTRREIGCMPQMLMGSRRSAYCPYLEPRLVHFCSSLPQEVTYDARFHDAVIKTSFPSVAAPYDDEIEGIYPPASKPEKIAEMFGAVFARKDLGLSFAVSEPLHQIKMLFNKQLRATAFWRLYGLALIHAANKNLVRATKAVV